MSVVCTHIYLKANINTSTEHYNSSVGYCTDQLAFQSGVGATYCERLACAKARTSKSNKKPRSNVPPTNVKNGHKSSVGCAPSSLYTGITSYPSVGQKFYLVRFHTYH